MDKQDKKITEDIRINLNKFGEDSDYKRKQLLVVLGSFISFIVILLIFVFIIADI